MLNTGEDEREQGVFIDIPGFEDVEIIARLFKEDMDDLGVETTLEDLEEVARQVVAATRAESPRCLCRVARDEAGGEPVGVVLANFNWSLKFAGRALWIEELYVTPAARRRGIGRILVETVLDWAEENGFRGIDLEAYHGNTPASVLYRALGFHRLGRERFYYRIDGSEYL